MVAVHAVRGDEISIAYAGAVEDGSCSVGSRACAVKDLIG